MKLALKEPLILEILNIYVFKNELKCNKFKIIIYLLKIKEMLYKHSFFCSGTIVFSNFVRQKWIWKFYKITTTYLLLG